MPPDRSAIAFPVVPTGSPPGPLVLLQHTRAIPPRTSTRTSNPGFSRSTLSPSSSTTALPTSLFISMDLRGKSLLSRLALTLKVVVPPDAHALATSTAFSSISSIRSPAIAQGAIQETPKTVRNLSTAPSTCSGLTVASRRPLRRRTEPPTSERAESAALSRAASNAHLFPPFSAISE